MIKTFFEVYANNEIDKKLTFKHYKQGQYLIIRPKQLGAKNKPILSNLGLLYKVLLVKKNKVFVKQVKYTNMLDDIVLKSNEKEKTKVKK